MWQASGLGLDQKERIDRMTLEEYLQAPPMTPEENAYASNVKFAKFNQENKATLPTIAAELIGWNNGERLVTGKDPLTGEDANRWAAAAELTVDIASNFYPIAKASKLRKLEKVLDAVDAVNDASKATKAVDKAKDASKATKAVDKASDVAKNAEKSIHPKSIKASDLSMTETVKNHANDVIKRGKYIGEEARPYVNNAGTDLIIQEIIDGGSPVKDKFLPNAWRWEVNGTFNGRQEGIWELVVDLDTNQIVHFNYVR